MAKMRKKSQSWSVDIILEVVIFMGAFFLFYAVLGQGSNTKAENLKEEAFAVIRQVASSDSPLNVVENNEVNISKLNQLKNLSYDDLKQRLRVEGHFCIYIEDNNGNLVLINNSYKGLGAAVINISGTPCSQK